MNWVIQKWKWWGKSWAITLRWSKKNSGNLMKNTLQMVFFLRYHVKKNPGANSDRVCTHTIPSHISIVHQTSSRFKYWGKMAIAPPAFGFWATRRSEHPRVFGRCPHRLTQCDHPSTGLRWVSTTDQRTLHRSHIWLAAGHFMRHIPMCCLVVLLYIYILYYNIDIL